jgi:cytochrome P450
VTHCPYIPLESNHGVPLVPDDTGARAPIRWNEALECWVVSDLALAREVLHHRGFSSGTFERSFQLYMSEDVRRRHRELVEFLGLWFVQADGAAHAALRRPLQQVLSPAYFRSLAPRLTQVVDVALDELAARPPHDVVPTVAEAVSGRMMAAVVGLDEEPAVLHRWAKRLSGFVGAMYRRDYAEMAQETLEEMRVVLRRSPALAHQDARGPQEQARAIATWSMNLFGGLETTSSLLSSVVLGLLTDGDARGMVRSDQPGAVETVVESVLRRRPPMRHLGRVSARDQEIAGVRLAAGDLVLVSLTGADLLDASEAGTAGTASFACPLDMDRSGGDQLAFGHGPHYCIGAPLARMEAAALARRFASRFPDARLAGDAVVWGSNLSYVGLDHLYVELGRDTGGDAPRGEMGNDGPA